MAHNYEKILAPFARNSNKDKYVDESKWSKPEFDMLKDISWEWTLKIDGTNLNIIWDGDKVSYAGHTDKTQWNERSKKVIEETFCTSEAETIFEDLYGEQPVTASMEFVSKDFNQNYGHPDGEFFVFDIRDGNTGKYWDRKAVETFAEKFNIQKAPVIMYAGTISEAVSWVKFAETHWNKNNCQRDNVNYQSPKGNLYDVVNPLGPYPIEGIVGRLPIDLYNGKGERMICKVKCKDFQLYINYEADRFHPFRVECESLKVFS